MNRIASKGIQRQKEFNKSKAPTPEILSSDSEDEDNKILKSVISVPSTSAINKLQQISIEEDITQTTETKEQDNISLISEMTNQEQDIISKELSVSDSDEEDAKNLEDLISAHTADNAPTTAPPKAPSPPTTSDKNKVEEYVPTPSSNKPTLVYQPSMVPRSSTPKRKYDDRSEARRYVPTSELLYDLNYIVNKINQNVGLAMYNAMVKEGLVKKYR